MYYALEKGWGKLNLLVRQTSGAGLLHRGTQAELKDAGRNFTGCVAIT